MSAFVLGVACAGLFADVGANKPEPLDRVVAVIDQKPVFLSDVRRQARFTTAPSRQVLEQIIDDELEVREATKAGITATPEEIDSGIKMVAEQAKMSTSELVAEAKKQGVTDAEYREMIGRQILMGKVVQLRVRARVKVTEADARAVYTKFVEEQTGPNAPVDLRIIALPIEKDPTGATKKKAEALAAQIVAQAKGGSDFCALVKSHSQDPTTTGTCGSRGAISPAAMPPDLASVARALKPGDVAAPILFTDPTGRQGYLVVQRALTTPPIVPSFESSKDEMMERASFEATERERQRWHAELRKEAYVEVRP